MMRGIKEFLRAKSLKWQILLRSFLVLIVLLIILGTSQYVIMKRYLYNNKVQLLESQMNNIDDDWLKELKSQKSLIDNATHIIKVIIDPTTSVVIIDRNGKLLAQRSGGVGDEIEFPQENKEINEILVDLHLSRDEYKSIMKEKNMVGYRLMLDKNKHVNIVTFKRIGNINAPSGLIQISTSIQSIQAMLKRQIYIYIGVSILMLILAMLIGGKILKRTLKPLFSMTTALEKVTVGDLNMRLCADNGQIEIDSLSNAFNQMLERLEISFEKEQYLKKKMQRFISDASHELRTPLTSIHGFVEVLLRGAAKNEEQLDLALNSIKTESERLTKLVNELLLLTKIDVQILPDMRVENIGSIVEDVYPQLQIIAGDRKVELNLKNDILAPVNANQIKQIIFNLFQNAVQHTHEKSGIITIYVNAEDKPTGAVAVLRVIDNGNGIKQEDLNELFDRFFRSETHRSRKHGGYGLGLAIVKSIVEAHEGEIEVNSEFGKGATFSVYLKLNKQ